MSAISAREDQEPQQQQPTPGKRAAPGLLAGRALSWVLAAALAGLAYHLHERPGFGREASFSLLSGAFFGVLLQRARFCYFCILREAVEEREVRPLLGILAALGFGTIGVAVIFGAWIPDASAGHLPPSGNIGPVGWPLALGGLAFGLGMAFSGSCVSAHLYRLGEGSLLSPLALAGAALGFLAGFQVWNPLYLSGYRTAPLIWLPAHLGFAGALLLQLAVLGLLAWLLWRFWQRKPSVSGDDADVETNATAPVSLTDALWVRRWPVLLPAVLMAALGAFVLLRTEPLGVTSALGSLVRALGNSWQWLPERLEGLDGLRGCRTGKTAAPLPPNALFVLALVAGSFAAALAGGHFAPERPSWRRALSALGGGVLLGFGAMISLGCTVGKLFSGITALSLCGWVFAAAMTAGVILGLKVRRLWW